MTQIQWHYLESMIGSMTPDDKSRLVTMLTAPVPADTKLADDPWIGSMADESDLLDEVMEGVYRARETHPLRVVD
jgi:hypothetical protein